MAFGTTYHSFNDIELFEPASPPKKPSSHAIREIGVSPQMKRQDSGYESRNTTPRTSISHPRTHSISSPGRRTSTSTIGGSTSRPRTRPSTRRSTKSYPHTNSSSVHLARPSAPIVVHSTYFQFPSPDPEEELRKEKEEQCLASTVPPQPTHYWTSDRTRKLEYAAIDAAQRGFKGWFRRNILPDCVTAKDERHIPFDDDTGSVRRYRLELEDETEERTVARKRRAWRFWS